RKHKKKGKSDEIEWLVINDKATLAYAVNNLESIDIHPWNSRIQNPESPDYIAIDIDPSDDDFSKVIETVLAAKEIFAKLKLKTFIKTSGKTGMHLLIPCSGIRSGEAGEARKIALAVCQQIHDLVPAITTLD